MREININIEGYNVNGICVGCLNYNRKMCNSKKAQECFKILGNIDVPDGLSIQVCFECQASVSAAMRFREQIISCYDVLIQYSREHIFLNSPSDLTQYSKQRLSTNKDVSEDNLFHFTNDDDEPKQEVPIEYVKDVKNEVDGNEYEMPLMLPYSPQKSEPDVDNYFDDSPSLDTVKQESTDEDIALSALKTEIRTKKSKKSKKSKTKNPKVVKSKKSKSDCFEEVQVSEGEMWGLRGRDVGDEGFVSCKYSCADCLLTFNSGKLMKDHRQGKHSPKSEPPNQCDVCKAYYSTKENLAMHRVRHFTVLKCCQCDFKTYVKKLIVKHYTSHGTTDLYSCNACEKTFSTKSRLSYHKSVCNQEQPQCDCCGKVFANKLTLRYHLKSSTSDKSESKPTENLSIPCKGCDKVFTNKKSYRAHVVVHDNLSYPCPVCGNGFRWRRNLARHLRNHHDRERGKEHVCLQCHKRFASRDCYNNHMRFSKKHAAEDTYGHECQYCGKKFATKWCMIDHVDWDHLKKIKYQCSVCLKAFKTAKIMVAHVTNIHNGKKKEVEGEHLCDICGKSYKTVKRLKGHVWSMHTHRSTSKSFRCKLCPATFTWQTSIYKHMKMMHQNNDKRSKIRPQPKPEPYDGLELSRLNYFQQNTGPVNIIVSDIV